MRFDWSAFCAKYHVEFVTRGPNVGRNRINIRCPWCGSSDPSQHMGLSLDSANPMWACHRDKRHRGRNPLWLVMRLLGCSMDAAKAVVDEGHIHYVDDLVGAVSQLRDSKPTPKRTPLKQPASISFPSAVKPINGQGYSGKFLDYLKDRGFQQPYLPVDVGDLHYAVAGDYRDRLIFPVYVEGKLVSFTGRDITGRATLRYKTPPLDQEAIDIKQCLYCEDAVAAGGDVLFITEGPFDALKLNCYLRPGNVATCFFGMPTGPQITKLMDYAHRWGRMCQLLDADARIKALGLHYDLNCFAHIAVAFLPQGAKDPGELSAGQVRKIVSGVLH